MSFLLRAGSRPLSRLATTTLIALTAVIVPASQAQDQQADLEQVAQRLRYRIEQSLRLERLVAAGDSLHALEALPRFYQNNGFRPIWVDGSRPVPAIQELVEVIRGAEAVGLRPSDYHLQALEHRLAETPQNADSALIAAWLTDLELLASDAFLVYAAHLVSGRVNPENFDPEWRASRREVDLVALLEQTAVQNHPAQALRELRPAQQGYERLVALLERYRRLAEAGGWTSVSDGPKLSPGDRSERVDEVRRRLLGDDPPKAQEPEDPEFFEAELAAEVERFQRRHGLYADGVIGPRTLEAMNVTVEQRLQQIELNLERWRWLPRDLGERHVVVNLPGFDLQLVEGDETVLEMRVIVGRKYRRTPVFSERIRYMVLNPYWEIPMSLALKDKLPEIRKNGQYFAEQKIRVLQGWGAEEKQIDPATVDWTSVGPGKFPYRLRQDPGPLNALGKIKFMFPNRYNVYLHDTPARDLFARSDRDVSSGCIRVEKPIELALALLRDDPTWDRERLEEMLASGGTRTINLERPVDVHLQYWTAWVDADGVAQFRADLYGRDALLAGALAGR